MWQVLVLIFKDSIINLKKKEVETKQMALKVLKYKADLKCKERSK